MKRREFVAALAAGTLGAVAGCTASARSGLGGGNPGGGVPADVAWPSVKREIPGWRLTNVSEDQINQSEVVTVYARTHEYENERLRRSVSQKTLGQFDSPMAKFFATHMGLRGVGTSLAGVSQLVGPVGGTLESEMEKIGLKNVREVEVGSVRPEIEGAKAREYRGEFEVPAIEKTINLSDVPKESFTLAPKEVSFTGLVAVWKDGKGSAYAGGGVFPAENYAQSGTFSMTSEKGDGIDLTVDVDLNLPVEQVREDVVEMVESIE